MDSDASKLDPSVVGPATGLRMEPDPGPAFDSLWLRRKGWPKWAVMAVSCVVASYFGLLFWTWQRWDVIHPHPDLVIVLSFVLGICTAALIGVASVAHRRRASRRIAFFDDGLSFPRWEGAKEGRWIPYTRIWAFHEARAWGRRYLVLNVDGRRSYSWNAASFVEPDAPERFAAAVRAGIQRLPDAAARFAKLEKRAASAAAAATGHPWLTWSFAAVLAVTFALQCWVALQGHEFFLIQTGGAYRELVRSGELYRLVTANLLHLSFLHLAGNVVLLILLGQVLERLVGAPRFGLVLGVGALSGMGTVVLAGTDGITMGASGSLYAAMALLIWVVLRFRDELPGHLRSVPPWTLPLLVLLAAGYDYFLVEILLETHVSVAAHVGGAIGGLVASAAVVRGAPLAEFSEKVPPLHRATAIAMGVTVAVVLVWGGAAIWSAWTTASG